MTRPRAADDFATIRARMDELRRERAQVLAKRGAVQWPAQGLIIEPRATPGASVSKIYQSLVAAVVDDVIGEALSAPDAPKLPGSNETQELVATLRRWIEWLDPATATAAKSALLLGTSRAPIRKLARRVSVSQSGLG